MFRNTHNKNLNHIETSQFICFANQFTGFDTTQAFTKRYLQTDFKETFQNIKNKITSKTRVAFRTSHKILDSNLSKNQSAA